VQPRMGFASISKMREGLEAVKRAEAPTVGTITLDSFTRTGDYFKVEQALRDNEKLNGYPIVTYSKEENIRLLAGVRDAGFPVQVRHGSSLPEDIFKAIIAAGIDATEGGPISYCLPYGRVPLANSILSWRKSCELFSVAEPDHCHIESFGGCMMGQLCPPSMLIAISVVEALFFKLNGIKSYSLSFSQGTNMAQDVASLKALRMLARKYLGDDSRWHIVFYNFMGMFPRTPQGARAIIEDGAKIAFMGKAERLIVKTVKEATEIPQIRDNIDALNWAYQASSGMGNTSEDEFSDQELETLIFEEASILINLLLNEDSKIEAALLKVFRKGYWDIPYCLHPDNKRKTTAIITDDGMISWAAVGAIPFTKNMLKHHDISQKLTSTNLYKMLSYNIKKYDSLSYF